MRRDTCTGDACFWRTHLARGARQFVVNYAFDTTVLVAVCSVWLTPTTYTDTSSFVCACVNTLVHPLDAQLRIASLS